MLFIKIHYLAVQLFTLTEAEKIKEFSYGLGIAGTGTAAHNNGRQGMSVLCLYGKTCQIKHIENVGITKLILKCKADNIKILDGVTAFKSIKRNIVLSHLLFHIVPGRKHTLTPGILSVIRN